MLQINLEAPAEAYKVYENLKSEDNNTKAKYVRLIVYGFSVVRAQLLKRVLSLMPLVHEIVLADRLMEDNLIVSIMTVLEDCAQGNPRLYEVAFADGNSEALWRPC